MPRAIEFTIEQGDITTYGSDVVALKHAQNFYGADKLVAKALLAKGVNQEQFTPEVGRFHYFKTRGAITAPNALFVGTPSLSQFGYLQIRDFMKKVLNGLILKAPKTKHLALTAHGTRMRFTGLDAEEAFIAQFIACLTAAYTGELPPALERVTIVEVDAERVNLWREAVEHFIANSPDIAPIEHGCRIPVGLKNKPHIFVAMAFHESLDDAFFFGIQWPILAAGYACERVDQGSFFTGDIVAQIRKQIERADLVVADLTQYKPNVFLEVGFALALDKQIILAINKQEFDTTRLPFDVQSHRCVIYSDIQELRELLSIELLRFRTARVR